MKQRQYIALFTSFINTKFREIRKFLECLFLLMNLNVIILILLLLTCHKEVYLLLRFISPFTYLGCSYTGHIILV